MEKAVNRRLRRARFRWENRSVREAEELGRGTNETYIWKPFRHAAQVLNPKPSAMQHRCTWGLQVVGFFNLKTFLRNEKFGMRSANLQHAWA